jgi:hypothetical protein
MRRRQRDAPKVVQAAIGGNMAIEPNERGSSDLPYHTAETEKIQADRAAKAEEPAKEEADGGADDKAAE